MPPIAIERAMSLLVWLGLVHGLWLGLAAPALATLVLRTWPGLPSLARHRLLLGAFLLATIGPFVMAAGHREAARRSARGPVLRASVSASRATGPLARPGPLREPRPSGPIRPNAGAWAARMAASSRPWVLAVWAAGLVGMVALTTLAFASSRRLLRQCRPAPEPVGREARRLGRWLGLRRRPPVLVHDSPGVPCLCGVIRPSVVLPAGWLAGARPGLVSAVLAHELAHAQRLDPLANLAHGFLEALVLFHPGARRLSRALRLQREHRADALAVRLTGDARALAEALEGFARLRLTPRFRSPLGASLGGGASSLLPRIKEILGMKSEPERIGPWPVVTLPAAALMVLAIATSGLAQEDPPAKAAAAPPPAGARPDDPQVSYEVALLAADDLAGFHFDFMAGEQGKPVRIAFASDLERDLLVRAVVGSPRGWKIQAPKVTVHEGKTVSIRMPQEPGRDLDDRAPVTSVALSGTLKARYVRLSVRLTEERPGAEQRGPEEAGGREVTCTLPSGGTVMLSADDPAVAAAPGRRRVILVTPRRVLTEEEKERVRQTEPGRGPVLPHPLRMPSEK